MNLLSRIANRLGLIGLLGKRNWRNIERFNETWKKRIQFMASFIERDEFVVVDLGCGPMWLKNEIGEQTKYIGVDYKDRGNGTLICDFNQYQFPTINADVYFVSGCMEYVEDWKWFIKKICSQGAKCIISYCSLDNVSNPKLRAKHAWVSAVKQEEIINEFNQNNMEVIYQGDFDSNNTVFVFIRKRM